MSKIHQYCKRCGRALKDRESQHRGYGPICYAKQLSKKIRPLFKK